MAAVDATLNDAAPLVEEPRHTESCQQRECKAFLAQGGGYGEEPGRPVTCPRDIT